jgi:hypothetical protein
LTKLHRLTFGVLVMSGTVMAQPATAPVGPVPGAAASGDATAQQAPLTPQQMVDEAAKLKEAMTGVMKRMEVLQDTARRQKDIIKLNCVASKMVQAKANVNISEQANASLQESISRADTEGEAHEFTRLTIIHQKVMVLGAEAENCIGEDLSFVGATRVDVEVDPNIPKDDPTLPPTPVLDVTRPPPTASVFI